MKKKLLVITDSLGLPRTKPEVLKVEDTWPQILRNTTNEFVDLFQYSVGGLTSTDVVEFLDLYMVAYDPDLIIIQVGIVDCCPRVLTKLELSILKRMPKFLRNNFRLFLRRNRDFILKYRSLRYVPYDKFEQNIEKIVKAISCKVVFVLVSPPNDLFEKHTFGIKESVISYNEAIKKHATKTVCVDESNKEKIYMSDMHHFNIVGNAELASEIIRIIEND